MRAAWILALGIIVVMPAAGAHAGTPAPAPSTTATPSASATGNPGEPTAAPSSATPTPSGAPAAFTVSGRLVVDVNGNGIADSADEAPRVAFLNLVPWSTADRLLTPSADAPSVVPLYSAPDGTFSFERIPAGSYTLEIIWFGGFVTKGASPAVPTLFRAAFGVTDKGEIVVPSPLPRSWPGSTEPLVPDEPVLGRIPDPILVMKIDNPNIDTIPVFDAGPAGPPPVGHVDVSAALQKRQQPEVHLPATGSQSSSDNAGRSYLLLGIAAGVLLSLAALLVRRARA
jgi:hypothetical protein